MTVFRYDEKKAFDLTLTIHQKGSATAGIFPFEIAEQKAVDAMIWLDLTVSL
jgi:ATP-dependent Clp protease adapter protein ClpS